MLRACTASYIVVYRQRPHLLFVTSQGPEAGQKHGPGRHFASSYSTRAMDLAKDTALDNSRSQTVHVIFICIVAKCPDLAGTVQEFGPMSRLCPGLPDFAALSRIPARLHKWRCGTSTNSVYYRISVRISQCLVGVAIHNRLKVDVVAEEWAWSVKFHAHSLYFILCPVLSSYKLGNYAYDLALTFRIRLSSKLKSS